MKGTSKVIMGATLVMVVSLAVVLALILVLLVELYCSISLRRRKLRKTTSNTTTAATSTNHSTPQPPQQSPDQSSAPSLTTFGVLHAPRTFLFPKVFSNKNLDLDPKQQFGNASTSGDGVLAGVKDQHFMYISNPIYDKEACRTIKSADTPFETPDTSPSHLEMGDSSGSSYDIGGGPLSSSSLSSFPITPPLTPMKKIPADACSVSLRYARFFGTSGSDSYINNNNGFSSSSGSPRNSPSW